MYEKNHIPSPFSAYSHNLHQGVTLFICPLQNHWVCATSAVGSTVRQPATKPGGRGVVSVSHLHVTCPKPQIQVYPLACSLEARWI